MFQFQGSRFGPRLELAQARVKSRTCSRVGNQVALGVAYTGRDRLWTVRVLDSRVPEVAVGTPRLGRNPEIVFWTE